MKTDWSYMEGNNFWTRRTKHGRGLQFPDAQTLMAACIEYFEHVDANPMIEEKIGFYEGVPVYGEVKHQRPYTMKGLCIFLDLTATGWHYYRKREEFAIVCEMVESIIHDQKLHGGMTGMFNANLTARVLGLAEQTETKVEHAANMEQAQLFTDALASLVERVQNDTGG